MTNDKRPLWPALINRIRGIAKDELRNNTDGIAVICVDMVVDNRGEPLIWIKPRCRRVEPSAHAARILLQNFVERVRGDDRGLEDR